jgi:hypothetical protein
MSVSDSIERSVWIPRERQFRRLDRIHLELAHVEGADRFSWLGNSVFELKSPTEMVGYGTSFRGDFADNRTLVFRNDWTKISYAGRVTTDGRPALRYEYDVHRGALAVRNGNQSGFAAARGAFWIDPETLDLLQIESMPALWGSRPLATPVIRFGLAWRPRPPSRAPVSGPL